MAYLFTLYVQIPTNGPRSFPDDYTLANQKHATTITPVCEQCDDSNKPVAYCHTCSDYLCDECLRAHKRLKAVRDHKTVNITPGKALDIEPQSNKSYLCSVHPEEPLKLYCKSCKSLACLLCFVGLHNGHDIGSIDGKARQEVEETTKDLVKETDSKLTAFEDNLKYVSAVVKEKTEASITLNAQVDKKVDFLIQQLEARRTELHKEIDDACTKDFNELWAQKEYHETAITSMEGALSFARRALACKEDTELLALCSQVTYRLKELSQLEWDSQNTEKIEMAIPEFKETNEQTYVQPAAVHTKKKKHLHLSISTSPKLVGELQSTAARLAIKITTNKEKRVRCRYGEDFSIQVTAGVKMNGNNAKKLTKLTISAIESQGTRNVYYPVPSYGAAEQIDIQENAQPNSWTVKFHPKIARSYRITIRMCGKYGDTTMESSIEHFIQVCDDRDIEYLMSVQ